MIITTNLLGSGKDGDPFRADFPTYTIAAYDFANARVMVSVPDDTLPLGDWTEADLYAHLDTRYASDTRTFRPRVFARG